MQISIFTCWILRENLIHYREYLLDTLIKTEIFTALYEQMIVFLIATMDSYLLWSTHRAKYDTHLFKASNFNVLLDQGLYVKLLAFTLTRNLNKVFILVEFITIVLV